MRKSFISRRVSEFVGVALFALALIWLIALASYSASRSGLVLQHRLEDAAGEFRRAGSARSSPSSPINCSATAAYLDAHRAGGPRLALLLVPHTRAAYTKLIGAGLLFGCVSSFILSRSARRRSRERRFVPAGSWAIGSSALLSSYLNRTGSIILILTLLFLAIILSTQFSLGRLFGVIGQMLRDRVPRSSLPIGRGAKNGAGTSNVRKCSGSISKRRKDTESAKPKIAVRSPAELAPALAGNLPNRSAAATNHECRQTRRKSLRARRR